MKNAKKQIVLSLSAIAITIVFAVGVFVAFTYESTQSIRALRRQSLNLADTIAPEMMTATIKQMENDYVVRTVCKNSFPWFKVAKELRVDLVTICDMVDSMILRLLSEEPANQPVLAEMLDEADKLRTLCPSEATSLRLRMIDGAFIAGQHERAIELMQQGMPGHDQNWIDGVVAKIRAHKAMDTGNWQEAVDQLRIFDKSLAGEPEDAEPNCDPTTGIVYCIEWVRAKNLYRISSLLEKLGKNEESVSEKAKAKTLYETALQKTTDDEKSLEALKAEMKSVGL